MFWFVLGVLFLFLALIAPRLVPDHKDVEDENDLNLPVPKLSPQKRQQLRVILRVVFAAFSVFLFFSTSYVIIDSDKVGHLKRIYLGESMPPGRIIALPGQKGPQAEILPPGFHLRPFVKILFDVDELPVVTVPQGQYGFVVAKDGKALRSGQYLADEWAESEKERMLDALYFMGENEDGQKAEPRGQKGPQLTVLTPGRYRLNRYLFDVELRPATDIPAGYVGVVKSNVGEDYTGPIMLPEGVKTSVSNLAVPLVPKGYKGIWNNVITPGRYYLNLEAYNVTTVDTRVQVWSYLGGYPRRTIQLVLNEQGGFTQRTKTEDIPVPKGAADRAVIVRVEGWEIPLDIRVQVQINPENAPFVVSAVGNVQNLEDKIITPTLRSVVRNVVAADVEREEELEQLIADPSTGEERAETRTVKKRTQRKALDLLYMRRQLESDVEKVIRPEGLNAGVNIKEVRFGDPVVPPELLIPGKRKQLADQLVQTFIREKAAQTERVTMEAEKARADQQPELMKSEIGKQIAVNRAQQRRDAGLGEEDYLKALARGQEAQKQALGMDKTFELARMKMILETIQNNPELIKVPEILVLGQGNGLEGAAAILGASNVSLGLRDKGSPVP